jgi:hypothetical protein
MAGVSTDYYGHPSPSTGGVSAAMTGATTGTAAGTIVAGGTIVTAAPSSINANDQCGSFQVTSASSAAGLAATVYFSQPYPANPKSIQVTCANTTSAGAQAAGVTAVSGGLNSGFNIYLATTVSTDVYQIFYHVQP